MTDRDATVDDFRRIYDRFTAVISRHNCGNWCAPLNNGEPVCCTTKQAIPIVQKNEYKLLQERTDMWSRFKPYDKTSRQIVKDLHKDCMAIECRGARHCERDNRTIACRAFPFFPYLTRGGDFVGLGYYWTFEDRCWMISHLELVERDFIREFVAAYESLFESDAGEYEAYKNYSATARRTFSRFKRPIPLIGREGGFYKIMPKSGEMRPAPRSEITAHGPYKSERAYRSAVKDAGGTLPDNFVWTR